MFMNTWPNRELARLSLLATLAQSLPNHPSATAFDSNIVTSDHGNAKCTSRYIDPNSGIGAQMTLAKYVIASDGRLVRLRAFTATTSTAALTMWSILVIG